MATVQVKNSATGDMGTIAAKRSRYEKAETVYGKVPADAYEMGDTLSFEDIPMKELIHAKFRAGTTTGLEIFHGADLSDAVRWDTLQTNGVTGDIHYIIEYIRGTGKVKTDADTDGEGELLQLWVTPPDATVVTQAADDIEQTTATLNGTVDPNGAPESVVTFEYGIETGVYTTETAAAESPLAYATTAQAVSLGLTGLTADTAYFFRVKAVTAAGTFYGDEETFTTDA
jgi:hypothetical protein